MEAKSPGVSASCRSPALSASARKLKDNAADWHNLIMKWDRLNEDGSSVANQIVNLKMSKEAGKEADTSMEGGLATVTPPTASPPATANELQDRCSALLAILEKMAHLVSKMEKLASSTKGVCELQDFHLERTGVCAPLFHTWPATRFDKVSSRLLSSYRAELALKEVLVGEIGHTSSPELALVYQSCWLYQPYLESSDKLLLESLLMETGHRAL